MDLSSEIRELRIASGLSFRAVSEQAGVALSTLQAVEAGEGPGSNPTVEVANRILGVFGRELRVGRVTRKKS